MTSTTLDIAKYCDSLYGELENMRMRLVDFVDQIENVEGPEKKRLASHAEHLKGIVDTIDWKLEILMRACPVEWKAYAGDLEETASVPVENFGIGSNACTGGCLGG